MRFFVARFHITKPANTAWAAANVRASLARLWVRFWSCRRTTHRFRWPFCTVRATCCHRVVLSCNNSRYRAGTFDSSLLVIYFFEKKKRRNKMKNSFEIISPEKFSYKKVNENQKKSQWNLNNMFRNHFLSNNFPMRILEGFCEDFGRILWGFCDFFGGVTIFQGAKIISNFWK